METNEYLGGDIQHIKLNQGNTKAVQDYLNYYAIVGDDDNGEMKEWASSGFNLAVE